MKIEWKWSRFYIQSNSYLSSNINRTCRLKKNPSNNDLRWQGRWKWFITSIFSIFSFSKCFIVRQPMKKDKNVEQLRNQVRTRPSPTNNPYSKNEHRFIYLDLLRSIVKHRYDKKEKVKYFFRSIIDVCWTESYRNSAKPNTDENTTDREFQRERWGNKQRSQHLFNATGTSSYDKFDKVFASIDRQYEDFSFHFSEK